MVGTVAVVFKTMDRSPRQNYLRSTLDAFMRAGGADSHLLAGGTVSIIDSGSPGGPEWVGSQVPLGLAAEIDSRPRTLQQNARECIRVGAAKGKALGARWVLVMEDDIDFCSDFLGSVSRWLGWNASPDRRLYSFGTPYDLVCLEVARGAEFWEYPIADFYGAQALVWSVEDAADCAEWLGPDPHYDHVRPEDGKVIENKDRNHDLLLARGWGQARGLTHFRASAPCFVQHIGNDSSLENQPFEFQAFAGTEWKYEHRDRPLLSTEDVLKEARIERV